MWRTRRVWPAAVALLAVAALVMAGAIQAQPVLKPNVVRMVPRTGPLSDPALLSGALSGAEPFEIFSPGQIVTPDNLPGGAVGWPLKLRPVQLKAGPSVQDLTPSPTEATIANRKFTVASQLPKLELADVAVAIDGIEAVARGQYYIHFRYTIFNNSVPKPIRFQLRVEGEAQPHMCWIPYVHASGGATNVSAYVVALMMGENTPLMARADRIGVSVVNGAGTNIGVFTKLVNYTFVKRYRDITRDDIKTYMDDATHVKTELPIMYQPPATTGGAATIGGGATATPRVLKPNLHALELAIAGQPGTAKRLTSGKYMLALQGEYEMEPAMVFCRTNQGNFAKTLLRAERTGSSPYHVAIWDSRCYAKNQTTFDNTPYMADGSPSNVEYIQLFERGGYLLNTWTFDFDRDGENVVDGQEDVWLENVSGVNTQKVRARNSAALAW